MLKILGFSAKFNKSQTFPSDYLVRKIWKDDLTESYRISNGICVSFYFSAEGLHQKYRCKSLSSIEGIF